MFFLFICYSLIVRGALGCRALYDFVVGSVAGPLVRDQHPGARSRGGGDPEASGADGDGAAAGRGCRRRREAGPAGARQAHGRRQPRQPGDAGEFTVLAVDVLCCLW